MPAICFPLPSQTYFMTQLNQDYCPRCLKDLRVPGCALTHPENYCPIAVLSPFAKILERLVYNQLNHFLEKENIVFKHQFGFRKNYSTGQAILELSDNLKMKIDNNAVYAVFFLTYLKPLILSTIRSYYRSYTDVESVVFPSNGPKAIWKR